MNQFFWEYIEMSDKMWMDAPTPSSRACDPSSRGMGSGYWLNPHLMGHFSIIMCAKGYTVVDYLCWISLVWDVWRRIKDERMYTRMLKVCHGLMCLRCVCDVFAMCLRCDWLHVVWRVTDCMLCDVWLIACCVTCDWLHVVWRVTDCMLCDMWLIACCVTCDWPNP